MAAGNQDRRFFGRIQCIRMTLSDMPQNHYLHLFDFYSE